MLILILKSILLGLLQGLTEFIPISSSAHLVIVPWLFGWTEPALTSLPFDVALHLGTLVAILWFFATDWVRLLRAGLASLKERKISADPDRRLAWFIVIGIIPGGIAGILLESKIEAWFHTPGVPIKPAAMMVMAVIIALLGSALFIAERIARHQRTMQDLSLKDTLIIGLAQAFAIFPGVSRAGGTITAGLALGLERATAARFSFLLGAPIIAGAGLKSLWDIYKAFHAGTLASSDLILFPIGFVVAALSGYWCIKFLLRFLQKNSSDIFVYYRWGLAVLVLIVAFFRS
jgi:undecaprenyl-diphosphatase